MELDKADFQHKRRIVNVDDGVILSQILDGREEYVTEVHSRTEMFSKPEIRDVFLYEEGSLNGFDARISQRVFVVGQIESGPDSALVSVHLNPEFADMYDAEAKKYAASVKDAERKAKKKEEEVVAVAPPSIMVPAKVKGDTLEISVKNLAKEATVPLHKGDTIVYREGVLTVEDASGEETHASFGVYALKSEKDSLILD